MAGSYRHITNSENEFIGLDLIDNLCDAYGALEECYQIIRELSEGDKSKIFEAQKAALLKSQTVNHDYIKSRTEEDYWK